MESAAVRNAVISTKTGASSAKGRPVGDALAELPARSWVAQSAVSLAETVSLSRAIAEPLSCIARSQTAGASLTGIASSKVILAETLLNLTSGRALAEIPSTGLTEVPSTGLAEVIHARVVAEPAAKPWIVCPPVTVGYAGSVEVISVDEVIIYENIVISPSGVPSPVVPASTPYRTKSESCSPG